MTHHTLPLADGPRPTITLSIINRVWCIAFKGAAPSPTSFKENAPALLVLAAFRRANPDCIVDLDPESHIDQMISTNSYI